MVPFLVALLRQRRQLANHALVLLTHVLQLLLHVRQRLHLRAGFRTHPYQITVSSVDLLLQRAVLNLELLKVHEEQTGRQFLLVPHLLLRVRQSPAKLRVQQPSLPRRIIRDFFLIQPPFDYILRQAFARRARVLRRLGHFRFVRHKRGERLRLFART